MTRKSDCANGKRSHRASALETRMEEQERRGASGERGSMCLISFWVWCSAVVAEMDELEAGVMKKTEREVRDSCE